MESHNPVMFQTTNQVLVEPTNCDLPSTDAVIELIEALESDKNNEDLPPKLRSFRFDNQTCWIQSQFYCLAQI
jgi:hypothetical protein